MQGIETPLYVGKGVGVRGQETLPVMQGIETCLPIQLLDPLQGCQETLPVMQGIETRTSLMIKTNAAMVRKPSP